MNTGVALVIIAEVFLFLFIVWGFLHENKLIAFEDRIIAVIRHNMKLRRQRRESVRRRRLNDKVRYTPERPTRRTAGGSRAA